MAAELKLLQNDEPRQVFPLPQGVLTIGRDPTNHIQLDSPAVNARHARIFTVGDASVIQNISGSSGIFINDEEIVRRELHNEDIVHIGSHRFQFVNPDAPARPVAGEELAVALPSQLETDDQPVISRLQQDTLDTMDDVAADLEAETVTSGSAGPDKVPTLSAPDDAIAEPEAADTTAPEK